MRGAAVLLCGPDLAFLGALNSDWDARVLHVRESNDVGVFDEDTMIF